MLQFLSASEPTHLWIWKQAVYRLVSYQHIPKEWITAPVQCNMLASFWYLEHQSWGFWLIPMFSLRLSKYHPEIQLLLRHELLVCKFHFSQLHLHNSLRNIWRFYILSLVSVFEFFCIYLSKHMRNILYRHPVLILLPCCFSFSGICWKPCLH